MTESHSPKPHRRWFAPSLRGLMVAVLVVGGVLGWQARQASIQKRAVAAIVALGGEVNYDFQRPDLELVGPNAEPWGPRWLRRLIGDDYFQTAIWVDLTQPEVPDARVDGDWLGPVLALERLQSLYTSRRVTDADLLRLSRSRRLRVLDLSDAAISDIGMASLGTLDRLESLHLVIATDNFLLNVTGAGMAHLAGLSRLEDLDIFGAKLDHPSDLAPLGKLVKLQSLELFDSPRDEACLNHLRGLNQLHHLGLRTTDVDDAGLAQIGRISDKFEELLLVGRGVTDAGLAHLANQSKLKTQAMGSLPGVTDVGLARLCDHPALEALSLNGSAVTDAGMAHVSRLTHLRQVRLARTAITDAGLAHLMANAGNLSALDVSDTRITDAVLVPALPSMKQIFSLNLARTAITDAVFIPLAKVTTLRRLDVTGTRVTPAAVAVLRAALPRLKIVANEARR